MPRKRKRHSAEFKARVALEGVKGVKTVQQLGKEFQVHPRMVKKTQRPLLKYRKRHPPDFQKQI